MLLSLFLLSIAAPLPPELEPWVPWLQEAHPEWACASASRCVWPGLVSLDADSSGASLVLGLRLDERAEVPLPGGRGAWPEQLRVQSWEPVRVGQERPDSRVVVLDRSGVPTAVLEPGIWVLEGRYAWPSMPQGIALPESWGLVQLTVAGEEVGFPRIDSQILRLGEGGGRGESRLELDVSRLIRDGVPAVVQTRLSLRASGAGREVDLGKVLPEHTRLVALSSELPARLGPQGELVVQTRPGTWSIDLESLYDGPLTSLVAPSLGAPWPEAEYWAFEAQDTVRAVTLSGPAGVDPGRTPLPQEWRGKPTFRVGPGETLQFEELRRGQPVPPENRLSQSRELWLDSDGKGYTFRDQLSGQMNQGWRLDLLSPGELGHASANGEDQVITQGENGSTGVELRQQSLNLTAEGRLPAGGSMHASGWSREVAGLSWRLHLPPGWTLFTAVGADSAANSLLEEWSLLDALFVGIMGLAAFRVGGLPAALLAVVGLGLSRPESSAPTLSWMIGLGVLALVGPGMGWRRNLRALVLLPLLYAVGTFAWFDLRSALFPQLARPSMSLGMADRSSGDFGYGSSYAPPAEVQHIERKMRNISLQSDPKAVVQTGPGIPNWTGTTYTLSWSGQVSTDQKLRLWLLPPLANFLLSLVRSGAMLGLFGMLLRRVLMGGDLGTGGSGGAEATDPNVQQEPHADPEPAAASGGTGLAVFLALLLLPPLSSPAFAQLPGAADGPAAPDLLQQLEERLSKNPCEKDCVSVPFSRLSATENTISITTEVHVAGRDSWPLPGPASGWTPRRIFVDGKPAVALSRQSDGFVHLRLEPGVHQVSLEGPLPPDPAFTLQFGMPPRRLEAEALGWRIDGVRPDGSVEGSVQLVRESGGAATTLEPSPWVEVHRFLDLGFPWKVRTELRRLGPVDRPLNLRLPLLPGESVTDDGFVVSEGAIQVSLGRDVGSVQWLSTLETVPELSLVAPAGVPWTEIWEISCSPVFSCATEGFPPLEHVREGDWSPLWRPWPGESLKLTVSRPEAAAGQTLTIDSAAAIYKEGPRFLEGDLRLVVRSSQGGKLPLRLPAEAKITDVRLDGASRPMQAKEGLLELPLHPGRQEIQVTWRQSQSPATLFVFPSIELGAPAVNLTVELSRAEGFWIPVVALQPQGPVMLWWGRLLLLLGVGLLMTRLAPLPGKSDWIFLCLGLHTIPWLCALPLALWWGLRPEHFPKALQKAAYVLWLLLIPGVLGGLLLALAVGLDRNPDVLALGAEGNRLLWSLDRSEGSLPSPWVLQLPVWTWRLMSVVWGLWLLARLGSWAAAAASRMTLPGAAKTG